MIEDFDQQNSNEEQYEEEEQLTPQQFAAEEERKLFLRRIIVIGAVVFAAAFYFVWANYLNFGYLQVRGSAPFSVRIIGEVDQKCPSSPCDIKLKRGEKIVSISKSGFTAESMEAEVILWTTVVLKPIFKLNAHIEEVTEISEGEVISEEVKYKFIYDKTHNNYAIVKSEDSMNFAISYFGGKIESPFIIGSEKAVLAFENKAEGQAFYINAVTKERSDLKKAFVSASRGSVSPNGRYFLIEDSGKFLFVTDDKSFSPIRVPAVFDNCFWTLKNTIVFAYIQQEKYIFDEYDPATGEQRTLFTSDSMLGPLLPKNIKVNPFTNTVFFESGEKKYELIF